MSNPFEYRDIMKASMRFNETRTVAQVQAEHEKHRNERAASRPSRSGGKTVQKRGAKRGPPSLATPTQSQLAALESLRQRALAAREAQSK